MNLKLIVWHLNRDLAIARGLASETEHRAPYTDATLCFNPKGVKCAKQLWDARCYEPVAVITRPHVGGYDDALEFAFEKTNHIDVSWNTCGRTPGVVPLHYERNRSTSVGDIVEVIDAECTFKFLCMPSGFIRVDESW